MLFIPSPSTPSAAAVMPITASEWAGLSRFFSTRAIAGLERVVDGRFERGTPAGPVIVATDRHGRPTTSDASGLVRRVLDADRDLGLVAEQLSAGDPDLAARLRRTALPRLPGAFDRFEILVRAIVGQQISVAAARTTLGRLCDFVDPMDPVDRHSQDQAPLRPGFPTAAQFAAAPLEEFGMPGRRLACLRACAEGVVGGTIDLTGGAGHIDSGEEDSVTRLTEQLIVIPGIGPWTAGYVAMRTLGAADAWPIGDLVLKQRLGVDTRTLASRAEAWRPWRAYASLLLWADE